MLTVALRDLVERRAAANIVGGVYEVQATLAGPRQAELPTGPCSSRAGRAAAPAQPSACHARHAPPRPPRPPARAASHADHLYRLSACAALVSRLGPVLRSRKGIPLSELDGMALERRGGWLSGRAQCRVSDGSDRPAPGRAHRGSWSGRPSQGQSEITIRPHSSQVGAFD